MADDREVLREVWDGRLPVCFQLAPAEVHTMQQPDDYYLMVPRQTYFPLVSDKVKKHFARYIQPDLQDAELWLEFNGMPLKWHYPVGVLFDLCAYDSLLPWNITVRFQRFPENELLHCSSREVVESHFMTAIKEADALKHRSHIINGMQKKDHNQLWQGLQNDKFDQFWMVNRKLMEHVNDELFRYIPFKVYQLEKPFRQKLFRPANDTKELLTLEDLILDVLPEWNSSEGHIVIQGIEVPMETPVQWLSEHFSHPDNFLHICIV